MDSLLDFGNLFIDSDAGELLYFLITVGLSFGALLIAIDQKTRSRREIAAGRYMVALFGVVVAWGFLTLGNVYTILTDAQARQILPPLERASTMLAIVILTWAFLTAESDSREYDTRNATFGLLALIVLAWVLTVISWDGEIGFNEDDLGLVWTVIPLAFSAIAAMLLLAVYNHAADIPLKLLFFGIVFAGHAYTLYQILSDNLTGDAAGTARLSMLAALTLVPVLLYRLVVERFRDAVSDVSGMVMAIPHDTMQFEMQSVAARKPDNHSSPSASAHHQSQQLLKILGMMLEQSHPDLVPQQIVTAVAKVFKADIVGLTATKDSNWSEVMAVYDYLREQLIAGLTINLANQPTLVAAMQSNETRVILPGEHDSELEDLFYRLDTQQSKPIGPAYFRPLLMDKHMIGVLILALPYTTRLLDDQERQLLDSVAPIASRLLALSRTAMTEKYADNRQVIRLAPGTLPEVDNTSDVQIRNELQAQLELYQQQNVDLNNQLEQLRAQLGHERRKMEVVNTNSDEGMSMTQKIQVMHDEREKLAVEREMLMASLYEARTLLTGATADHDEVLYRQMVDALQQEKEMLLAEKDRLEEELHLMRSSSGDVSSLNDVLIALRTERDRMAADQSRLTDMIEDSKKQLADLGLDMGMVGLGQMLAHLTEERNRFMQESKRAMAERDALLKEREQLTDQVVNKDQYDDNLSALRTELSRIMSDREVTLRQRDALKAERDSLNEQRGEWLSARTAMAEKYEELRRRFHDANLKLAKQ